MLLFPTRREVHNPGGLITYSSGEESSQEQERNRGLQVRAANPRGTRIAAPSSRNARACAPSSVFLAYRSNSSLEGTTYMGMCWYGSSGIYQELYTVYMHVRTFSKLLFINNNTIIASLVVYVFCVVRDIIISLKLHKVHVTVARRCTSTSVSECNLQYKKY